MSRVSSVQDRHADCVCDGGRAIPAHWADLYDWGIVLNEDNFIQLAWQQVVCIRTPEGHHTGLDPDLLVCDRTSPDGRTTRVARLRWMIGGYCPHWLSSLIPDPLVLVEEDAPTPSSRDALFALAQRAVATICDLHKAGDRRILEFFPPRDRAGRTIDIDDTIMERGRLF